MTIFTRTLFIAAAALWPAVQGGSQQSIEIWSVDPIAIDIEWLTIDERGQASVTARRATVIGPPVPLEFTHGPDRFVRFSYRGASPRTYSTSELIAARKLHVPDVLPGGELFIVVPQAPVRPVRLRLEGPRSPTVDVTAAGHVSLAGMPEGDYRIVLIYDGGVPGAIETATVRAAQSAIAPLPIEEVGGVLVIAAHDACGTATEMGINQLVVARVGPEIKSPPNRVRWAISKEPQCSMRFGGLKPGDFEVFYRAGRSPSGTAFFSIASQAWTTAEVASSTIRLEGRVTLNGAGAGDNARVTVMARKTAWPVPPQLVEVSTNPGGHYSAALEAPGTYEVIVRIPQTMFQYRKEIPIVEGRNLHDIAIVGGRLILELRGWDQKTRLQVSINGRQAGGASAMYAIQLDAIRKVPVFEGLPFGEYEVSVLAADTPPARTARSRIDLRRNAQRVILSRESPTATLTFDLSTR